MMRRSQALVRGFLPLVALGCCFAYVGRDDSATAVKPAAVDAPAVSNPASSNNAPPTIVPGSVAHAQVGATFAYQPVAQDPESDTLRFTAINLPSWASLDSLSGRITGTPGPMDAGVYESISITVADAGHEVATAPFSITVNPALESDSEVASLQSETPPSKASGEALDPALESGSGVASLQWETPPSKVSGEPLDDLAGYRILYGHNSADLDHSVLITDPATTSYQFSTLTPGIWYFAVVAVSSGGLEGPPTTLASKSI